MSTYSAGGGKKLGIIRHGRELMERFERIGTTAVIMPGDSVEVTSDANGDPAFQPHTGSVPENEVYVAVEARQRGMDAQTDTGYKADEDLVIAVKASGGGLNLTLSDGETVTEGDALVVDPSNNGQHVAYVAASHAVDDIVAYAAEDLDLSGGAAETGLVAAEME